ncbi:Spc24-domain-containing protein [Piedraia hortae CBS 480.64]|uniref:Kinetochore protein Spc24 n=1 Tax=Piedraia hortae CBS 480.64 TaxID=1314780 RepID=A0A6A7BZR9_9PEZI|nr:Spc24-domain-containing protein [Piedraia hortae CBS 480.64]
MVLFDDDPANLMLETKNQFLIEPDKEAQARTHTVLQALQQTRQQSLQEQQHLLKTLSRRLNKLQSQQSFEEERHDAAKHASEVLKLDTEKFRMAKGVSEAEVEGERLSSEIARLQAILERFSRGGIDLDGGQGAGGDNEVVLKLQFYRSLGIDISQDADTGEVNRAIIRNADRDDVDVITIDGSDFDTDRFWSSMS